MKTSNVFIVELDLENKYGPVYVSEFFVADENPKYKVYFEEAEFFYYKDEARMQAETAEEVYKKISGREEYCTATIRTVELKLIR